MTSSAPGPSTSTGTGTGTAVSTGQFSFPPIHSYPPFYSLQVNTSTLQSQLSTWSTIVRDYCRHRRLFRLSLSDQLDSALFYNRPLGKRLKEDDARRVLDFMRERQASAEPADGVSGVGGAAAAKRKADVWWIWWRKVDEWAGIIEAWDPILRRPFLVQAPDVTSYKKSYTTRPVPEPSFFPHDGLPQRHYPMLKSNWNEQVDEVGQKNTVLTLYELTQGDLTRGTGIEASLFFLSFPSQPLSTHLVVLYLLHPHPLLSSDDPLQHDPSQSNTATHSYPRPCTELHELDQEVLQKALAVLVKRGKAQVFGSDDRLGVKFF